MNKIQSRVQKIHESIVIVDAHLDLAYELYKQRFAGKKKVIETQYLEDFKKGSINVIVSSIYVDNEYLPESALRQAVGQIGALYAELEESPNIIRLCRTYNDIEETLGQGKIAILLSFEGVEPLGNDLELLRVFYELGVRVVGLCWSRRNCAADGSFYTEVEAGQKSGLTNFGFRLVREAENLGMLIDVSHLNDEGFQDVIKISQNPLIASHSNCRVLHGTMRNLSDEQIKSIAAKNGVIGVNSVSALIADCNEQATVEYLVDHIDHIVKLVGVEHVGLGFDFCERILPPQTVIEVNGAKMEQFDVIQEYSGIHVLTNALLNRGYSEEDIELIYGKNFMRAFRKILI